jgi:hypothetical protein
MENFLMIRMIVSFLFTTYAFVAVASERPILQCEGPSGGVLYTISVGDTNPSFLSVRVSGERAVSFFTYEGYDPILSKIEVVSPSELVATNLIPFKEGQMVASVSTSADFDSLFESVQSGKAVFSTKVSESDAEFSLAYGLLDSPSFRIGYLYRCVPVRAVQP